MCTCIATGCSVSTLHLADNPFLFPVLQSAVAAQGLLSGHSLISVVCFNRILTRTSHLLGGGSLFQLCNTHKWWMMHKQVQISVILPLQASRTQWRVHLFHIILMGREKGIIFPEDIQVLSLKQCCVFFAVRERPQTPHLPHHTTPGPSVGVSVSESKLAGLFLLFFFLLQVPGLICHELQRNQTGINSGRKKNTFRKSSFEFHQVRKVNGQINHRVPNPWKLVAQYLLLCFVQAVGPQLPGCG